MAVIDLGSNSAKLVCYSARPHRRVPPIPPRVVPCQVGRARLPHDPEAPIARLLDVLKLFQNTIQYEGSEPGCWRVATSAVRGAKNREDIISRIRDETGPQFQHTVRPGGGPLLVHGGCHAPGHAGLHILRHRGRIRRDSGGPQPYGAVCRVVPLGGAHTDQTVRRRRGPAGRRHRRMREYVLDTLPARADLGPLGGDAALVGVGGALRAISRYAQSYADYPIKKIPQLHHGGGAWSKI